MRGFKFIGVLVLICMLGCVSTKKYDEAVNLTVDLEKKYLIALEDIKKCQIKLSQKDELYSALISTLHDSISQNLQLAHEHAMFLNEKYEIELENIKAEYELEISEIRSTPIVDTDGDGINDSHDLDPLKPNTFIIEKPSNATPGKDSNTPSKDILTDIPMGHALQRYIAIPHCPDSIEAKKAGYYIEVLIDFTNNEDSIDIDVLEVAINHGDTANIELIKKRILAKDIYSLAKYLKVIVDTDKNSPLTITPDVMSSEYAEVSSLFNEKRTYRWKLRCDTPGNYNYSMHVAWFNIVEGKHMPLRQDEIERCPKLITVYELPKSIFQKGGALIAENFWKGFSAAIVFILGFVGKSFWGMLFANKKESSTGESIES